MADELNGFDMVWAITEKTLNEQLAWRFTRPAQPGQPSLAHVTFGELFAADGTTVKDGFHVDAVLGAPWIEIPEGNTSTIELFLPFASGTLQHLGVGNTGVYTVDLAPDPKSPATTTWVLCFKTDLNLADITQHLDCAAGTPPPMMHQETYSQLCQFKSSGFSIQQLFLNLENVDLASYLPQRSSIPAQVTASVTSGGTTTPNQPDPAAAQALQLALLLYFKNLSADSKSSPYILGYSANAGANQSSALQPTGTAYSTHRYQPMPRMPALVGASTLNLLLVTDNRTPPSSNLAFNYNLVDRPGISGTARISPRVLASDWLSNSPPPRVSIIEAIAWAAGVGSWEIQYLPATYEWTGTMEVPSQTFVTFVRGKKIREIYVHSVSIKLSQRETDANGRSGPGLAITGGSGIRLYFNDDTLGHGTYTQTLPFSMSIVMLPGPGQSGASISLSRSHVTTGKPQISFDVRGGDPFARLLDQINVSFAASEFARLENLDVKTLEPAVSQALGLFPTQIVLPAPATFAYTGLWFDDQLVLTSDFTYVTR